MTTIMINSTAQPGALLPATRLVLLRRPARAASLADSHDFQIETHMTPERFAQYSRELDALWGALLRAAAAGAPAPLPRLACSPPTTTSSAGISRDTDIFLLHIFYTVY